MKITIYWKRVCLNRNEFCGWLIIRFILRHFRRNLIALRRWGSTGRFLIQNTCSGGMEWRPVSIDYYPHWAALGRSLSQPLLILLIIEWDTEGALLKPQKMEGKMAPPKQSNSSFSPQTGELQVLLQLLQKEFILLCLPPADFCIWDFFLLSVLRKICGLTVNMTTYFQNPFSLTLSAKCLQIGLPHGNLQVTHFRVEGKAGDFSRAPVSITLSSHACFWLVPVSSQLYSQLSP